jgi:hypothetical protein
MSELLNKSEINFDAAKVLHKADNYPSVAHCSYYSCYQMLKHIWLYPMDKSDSDLKAIIDNSQSKKAAIKGSHDVLINEIEKHIKLNNTSDFRVINSTVGQLKRLRHSADYEDKAFLFNDSCNSIELSERIRLILKKYTNK